MVLEVVNNRSRSNALAAGTTSRSSGMIAPLRRLDGAQRLIEIPADVDRVFNPNRNPDQVGTGSGGNLLLLAQLLVSGAGGVDDQRFGVADVGEMRDQGQAFDETRAGL